ncbi:hypothetical protein [Rouxiella sp. WC2420]|uniref:Uncharacterized protein n=1 Tax=Rouxiella sp. WC2420 TaxID=3234145 RepID=A0AB39VK06_9GAMM
MKIKCFFKNQKRQKNRDFIKKYEVEEKDIDIHREVTGFIISSYGVGGTCFYDGAVVVGSRRRI